MRPQRRETAHRPGTGTLPPMERQPRRPPHLGTAPAHRINPAQITPAPAWPPRTATSALGMPSHRTSEYLRPVDDHISIMSSELYKVQNLYPLVNIRW